MGRDKFDESDFQSFYLKCNDSLDSLQEASDLARNILSETSYGATSGRTVNSFEPASRKILCLA